MQQAVATAPVPRKTILRGSSTQYLGRRVSERISPEPRDGIECFPHVVPCRGVVHDAEPEGQRPAGN